MTYISDAYVYLSIYGSNLNVDDLVVYLGISPTSSGETRKKEKFYEFRVKAEDPTSGLRLALERLQETFNPYSKKIKQYVKDNSLGILVFVVINSRNREDSGFPLSKSFLKFINSLDAEIGVAVYNYS